MERLRILRTQAKMTQAEVAVKIGVDRSTYAKYETGQSEPNFDILKKLAAVFDTSIASLFSAPDLESISENDIKAAFFNGADPTLTPEERDAMWEDAQEYFRFKIAQRRQKQQDEQ